MVWPMDTPIDSLWAMDRVNDRMVGVSARSARRRRASGRVWPTRISFSMSRTSSESGPSSRSDVTLSA